MPQAQQQEAAAAAPAVALGTAFTFRPAITERARATPARSTRDLLNHLYTLPVAHIRQKKEQELLKQQQENGEVVAEASGDITVTMDAEGNEIQTVQDGSAGHSADHSAASPTGGENIVPRKSKKISTREFDHIYKTLLSYRELADMKRKEKAQELMAKQGLQDVPTIDQHSRQLAAGRYRNTGGNVWTELYNRSQQVSDHTSPQSARAHSPQPPTGIPRRARTPQPRYHDQYEQEVRQTAQSEYDDEIPQIQVDDPHEHHGFDPSISPVNNPTPIPTIPAPAPPKPTPIPPPVQRATPVPVAAPVAPQAGGEVEQGVVLGTVPSRLIFTVPKRTSSTAASSTAARSAPKTATTVSAARAPTTVNSTAARQRIAAESQALQQRQGYNPAAHVPFMGHYQGNGLPVQYAVQQQGWGAQPQGFGGFGAPTHSYGGTQAFFGAAPGMAAMAYRGMAW